MKTLKAFATPTLAIMISSLSPVSASGVVNKKRPELDQDKQDTAFWKSVYEENHVLEIDISLTQEAWKAMQPAQSDRGGRGPGRGERPERRRPVGPPGGRPPGGGPPPGGGGPGGQSNFEYVKADLTIDGELFKDSGLRFKGNSSYRAAANSDKRPLKIDTNRFIDSQKLHGRTKLNLSTSFLDPAYMKEKLAYEMYEAAGIPTPGTGWAKVTLSIKGESDKKLLGIYVLVEQVDPNYLARQFGEQSKDSLLMKPESTTAWQHPGNDTDRYKEAFGIKAGDEDEDQIRKFGEFLTFINDASDTDFARQIGEKLDLDLFGAYLATTCLLSSIDSYIAAPHNYYLVFDKSDGRARLLPWDVNEAFGTHSMGASTESLIQWDIDQPWVSDIPLVKRLFATEDFPKLYEEKLTALMENSFTEKHLFSRIETFANKLKPHLTREELEELRLSVEGNKDGLNTTTRQPVLAIKPFVKKRIKSVEAQLAGKSAGLKIEDRARRGPRGRPESGRPPRPNDRFQNPGK